MHVTCPFVFYLWSVQVFQNPLNFTGERSPAMREEQKNISKRPSATTLWDCAASWIDPFLVAQNQMGDGM